MAHDKLTFTELDNYLNVIPDDVAVLIVGGAGIGKSSFVRDWNSRRTNRFYEKNCAEMLDIGDFLGINSVKGGRTVPNPPPWFDAIQPTDLFLDEINRAGAASILRGVMGLVLSKSIADMALPKGSRIIAAINPERSDSLYDVIPFDLAQNNRFWVAEVRCDYEDWKTRFAVPNGVHATVISYLDENPGDLNSMDDEMRVERARNSETYRNVLATPRTWTWLSDSMYNVESLGENVSRAYVEKLARGYVGEDIAPEFAKFYVSAVKNGAFTPKTILYGDPARWETVGPEIFEMCNDDALSATRLCSKIGEYMKSIEGSIHDDNNMPKKECKELADNFLMFVRSLNTEIRSYLFRSILVPLGTRRDSWIRMLCIMRKEIQEIFSDDLNQ